jgi:hypothetical protein
VPQTHIDNLVRDLLLDDPLVLGVDSDLHVIAHRNMRMRRHRSAVGVGERDLAPMGNDDLRRPSRKQPRENRACNIRGRYPDVSPAQGRP